MWGIGFSALLPRADSLLRALEEDGLPVVAFGFRSACVPVAGKDRAGPERSEADVDSKGFAMDQHL